MILIAVLDDIDVPMGVIKYELSLFFFSEVLRPEYERACPLSSAA